MITSTYPITPKYFITKPSASHIVLWSIFPCHPPFNWNKATATAPHNTCNTPDTADNINAALAPPRLSAYTAIVALSKNTGTNPVIINTGDLNISNPAIEIN